ncbi:MAG: hypothetical protein ACFFCS_26965 [Candidatus Hodarchaeota archaeon]
MINYISLFDEENNPPEEIVGGILFLVGPFAGSTIISFYLSKSAKLDKLQEFLLKADGPVHVDEMGRVVKPDPANNMIFFSQYVEILLRRGRIEGTFDKEKGIYMSKEIQEKFAKEQEKQERIDLEEAKKKVTRLEKERVEKLKTMIKVTEDMAITRMAKVLGMDEEDLWDRIFDWVNQFGFTIKDDKVLFGKGNVNGFIDELDKLLLEGDDSGVLKEDKRTVIIKEIVKIKCPFCGMKVEQGKSKCPECGGSM